MDIWRAFGTFDTLVALLQLWLWLADKTQSIIFKDKRFAFLHFYKSCHNVFTHNIHKKFADFFTPQQGKRFLKATV